MLQGTSVLQDKTRSHLSRVANIAATGMEAHDHLNLQPQRLDKVEKLAIACPVIPLRLPFNCSPLHHDHPSADPYGEGTLCRDQVCLSSLQSTQPEAVLISTLSSPYQPTAFLHCALDAGILCKPLQHFWTSSASSADMSELLILHLFRIFATTGHLIIACRLI